jgi:hypothetical protein
LYSVSKILGTSIEEILTGDVDRDQGIRNDSKFDADDIAFVEKYKKLDDCEKQIILGKISEFLYNKKLEENSARLSPQVLWDLLADSDHKDTLVFKRKD